jgi:large subunit ribosomal protein L21
MASRGKPVASPLAMPYAVIRTGGKQYRVAPGETVHVEHRPGDVGAAIEFTEVLLTGGDGATRIGTPLVEGVRVRGQIVAQGRGRKILIFKKKRRKNYRRRRGHRQEITSVRVTEIA